MDALKKNIRKMLQDKSNLKMCLDLKIDSLLLPDDIYNSKNENFNLYIHWLVEQDIEFLKNILRELE